MIAAGQQERRRGPEDEPPPCVDTFAFGLRNCREIPVRRLAPLLAAPEFVGIGDSAAGPRLGVIADEGVDYVTLLSEMTLSLVLCASRPDTAEYMALRILI